MPFRYRLSLKAPSSEQDNFFLWSMVILPIIAEGAIIFDAYYFLTNFGVVHRYQGLFSTIVVVFAYLRYCAPIESPKILAIYYTLLCAMNELGTIGYIIVYVTHSDTFNTVIYVGWALLELIMTSFLIYFRVFKGCLPSFHVESKHLFHFISRLEVILAIFIPFFSNSLSVTLTKHSIAFFLLFDFFSDSYSRLQGFWIKFILYLFVCTVTVCVGSEWFFSIEHVHIYEIISSTFELISGCLCNTLIILQFIPYHLKPLGISKIAREGLIFHQMNGLDFEAIEIITEQPLTNPATTDSVLNLVL